MKIALVGVPKTGKTKFARNFVKENRNFALIDNIPQKFSKDTGLAIGIFASPVINFALAGQRFYVEAKTRTKFITTTSVLDSVVYSTFGIILYKELEDLSNSEYQFTASYLSGYFLDGWSYDKTYYLPYRGKDQNMIELDRMYRDALELRGIGYETVNK